MRCCCVLFLNNMSVVLLDQMLELLPLAAGLLMCLTLRQTVGFDGGT